MNTLIQHAIQTADRSKERLLKTFAAVPDEKLSWSPAETSKSPLNLVAHVAFAYDGMSKVLSGKSTSMPSMEEIHAWSKAAEAKVTTREQAIAELEISVDTLKKTLEVLPESRLAENGPMDMPMTTWIFLPSRHADGHAAQLDYIQTIYGDTVDHF